MSADLLRELGHLALATRMKRISDRMIHSGREMYKRLGIDIEPNWYMIFKLLQKHETLTVMEIANYLQLSHPSVITIIDKMSKNDYLNLERSKADGRKQLVRLSAKAHEKLPELEKIWEAGTESMGLMMQAYDILSILDFMEDALEYSDFKTRTIEELQTAV